jgi:peroxiredoxin
MPPGTPIPQFSATTTTERKIRLSEVQGKRVAIAFFSPSCIACREQIPPFIQYANKFPTATAQIIAVVVGDEPAAEEYASLLGDVALVVREDRQGGLMKAFKVEGMPSFYVLDESAKVMASGPSMQSISMVELA